jgi:hypothetical protein
MVVRAYLHACDMRCAGSGGGSSKSSKAGGGIHGETVHWSGVVVHLATPVCVECAQHAIAADRAVRTWPVSGDMLSSINNPVR